MTQPIFDLPTSRPVHPDRNGDILLLKISRSDLDVRVDVRIDDHMDVRIDVRPGNLFTSWEGVEYPA